MVSTGDRIQSRRKALNLSRAQLAERLRVTYLQVYRLEMGKTRVSLDILPRIAKALETTVARLVA